MSDIINLLRDKEKEAEAALTAARAKAEAINEKTLDESAKILKEADEDIKKERKEMELLIQKQTDAALKEIKRQGKEETEAIQRNSGKRYEDAVKIVLDAIMKNP